MVATIEESMWSKLGDGKRDATEFIQLMVDTKESIFIPHGT